MSGVPYGSWPSPVTVDHLTSASVGLSEVRVDGRDLYWLEARADQGGRCSIWRAALTGGEPVEVTPGTANVRTRVHEYGGGAYDVAGGVLVYAELADGRLRVVRDGVSGQPISPAGELRYADLRVHPGPGLVLAVREDHRGDGEAVNTLVALDLDGPNEDGGVVLCSGADFYSTPELSPDGRLAWVQWDHPAMPWDVTALLVGRLQHGPDGWRVSEARQVAGGPGESAIQPRWLPDGTLVHVSDRTGWWNLYALHPEDPTPSPLCSTEAEFAGPQWVFGQTPYAVLDQDRLVCAVLRSGRETVELLRLSTGALETLAGGGGATDVAAGGGRVAAVLSHRDRPSGVAVHDLETGWSSHRLASALELPPGAVSVAQPVSWPADPADPAAGEVHGWFYPPTHPEVEAPPGELPPLITLSHGGPTAFSSASLSLGYQFWTSRGYAVLDVNYGGSTGYGRAYRQRLAGRWGLVDVADCAAGAVAMGERGLVDPARLAVKGGSAGGYTTLRALTATRVFAAGISQYGVGDLEALALHTHKFESRYLDGLVGPYPQDRDVYLDRSPLQHLDTLAAPILLLQGTEDKVVPPSQAADMAAAARASGLAVALLLFEGEGHGFRRAETIRASLDAQQYFLGRIFGFTPADDVPTIAIDNLS